jgi:hypothetical protein
MMAVETQTGPAFHAGHPKAMFKMPYPSNDFFSDVNFAVSPDPNRFLVKREEEAANAPRRSSSSRTGSTICGRGAGELVRCPATQSAPF